MKHNEKCFKLTGKTYITAILTNLAKVFHKFGRYPQIHRIVYCIDIKLQFGACIAL